MVTISARARLHAAGIAAVVGLGQSECADEVALGQLGQQT
jgi:hypothetical protein